jgi:hypothetical protein
MDEMKHDTLHPLHGRLREIVGGRPRFCFYGAESDASDQKQARIVLILKSGDKGKYWKGGALCGDRVVTKLPTIADTMERVCCERVRLAGKERRAAGRCDRREGNSCIVEDTDLDGILDNSNICKTLSKDLFSK